MVFRRKKKQSHYKLKSGIPQEPEKEHSKLGKKVKGGLKIYGKALLKTYTEPFRKKSQEELEEENKRLQTKLHRVKIEHEIATKKHQISKLKSTTSSNIGIQILKSIKVPDYIGSGGVKIDYTKIYGSAAIKKKKKAPWEII